MTNRNVVPSWYPTNLWCLCEAMTWRSSEGQDFSHAVYVCSSVTGGSCKAECTFCHRMTSIRQPCNLVANQHESTGLDRRYQIMRVSNGPRAEDREAMNQRLGSHKNYMTGESTSSGFRYWQSDARLPNELCMMQCMEYGMGHVNITSRR